MAERRSLVEGVKTLPADLDPDKAREFVYGANKARGGTEPNRTTPTTPVLTRSPISTRMRTDFATALKRASLERQLKGVEPSTLQDILEEAIEPWLRSNGYLD